MKIRIWRRTQFIWCWHCPICGKTWRNREIVPVARPIRPTKYWPLWSTEVNTPSAWVRCVTAAHVHIKKFHAGIVKTKIIEKEKT